jgi:hypothetical protein
LHRHPNYFFARRFQYKPAFYNILGDFGGAIFFSNHVALSPRESGSESENRDSRVMCVLADSEELQIVESGSGIRVARFFLVQHSKMAENIPNIHKIYQMAAKYIKWS